MSAMQFFVMDELTGQQTGPYTLQEVHSQIWDKKLKKNDFIRKGDSSQWSKAGDLLAKIFENVQTKKQQQKEHTKAQRAADKEQKSFEKMAEKREKSLNKRRQQQFRSEAKDRVIDTNRGTMLQKIFGESKPSPYWGFDIQASIINISIGLVLVAAVFGFAGGIVVGVLTFFTSDAELSTKLFGLLFSLIYSLSVLIAAFLAVALLVFYRNCIDWLIDMEAHANALRKHFEH